MLRPKSLCFLFRQILLNTAEASPAGYGIPKFPSYFRQAHGYGAFPQGACSASVCRQLPQEARHSDRVFCTPKT